ncbi:MAG: ammonium transporter [Chloroflexi bacterium]|nr:ammonium transporter [Chloroflexota bacterium]
MLPLGVWLVLSAASPRAREGRVAASGMVAFTVSTLLYAAIGFGFMFGGIGAVTNLPELGQFVTYFTLPVDDQSWGLIGLRGFFLNEITTPAALSLFASYLPMVITCALFVTSLMAQRTGLVVQAVASAVVSGVIFPIVGFWIWGGGWLGATGTNLNLGHGAVDLGGLSFAALVAGGAGLAWLITQPRRQPSQVPALPPTTFPFRAVSGSFCALIGTVAFVFANPLYSAFAEAATGTTLLNLLISTSLAALVALTYSAFVSRRVNVLLAARAFIAALIAFSSGSMLLPSWSTALLGALLGLIAGWGLYLVNERLHWPDDAAAISTVLFPAMLGLTLTGLLANGGYAPGWGGIGTGSYLGVADLGIVGILAPDGIPSDPGQLTAQVVATVVVLLFSFSIFTPVALILRRLSTTQAASELEELEVATEEASESVPAAEMPPMVVAPRLPLVELTQFQPQSVIETTAISAVATPVSAMTSSDATGQNDKVEPAASEKNGTGLTEIDRPDQVKETKPARRESLLDRLRRARNGKQIPEPPSQARHVAYPNRIGGRRIIIRPTPPNNQQPANDGEPLT